VVNLWPLVVLLVTGSATADSDDVCEGASAEKGTRAVVTPGPNYGAHWPHRFLLGGNYRELWTTPIGVEVLDLRRFAGGLKPVGRDGVSSTRGLALEGRDGRRYRFRSVDKDPKPGLPRALRGALSKSLVQDHVSAQLPGAAVVVSRLEEAAGILHVRRQLVVLPDDAALGKYREEFAGMLGTLEEEPRAGGPTAPGFEGSVEILKSDDLLIRLDASPADRIDARAFLKARLFDVLIGDRDRGLEQWEWIRRAGDTRWQPLPRNRDKAFVKSGGLLLSAVRQADPPVVHFGPGYGDVFGLIWDSRDFDRRILAELDEPTWTEVVEELQQRLSDDVIERAVCALPGEYHDLEGTSLSVALRSRRDRLPEAARDFYRLVTRDAEIVATDADEIVRLDRRSSGEVEVRIATLENGAPYFQRVFRPRDTGEIRLYLRNGHNQVVVQGRDAGRIRVRVIGEDPSEVVQEGDLDGVLFYGTTTDRPRSEPWREGDNTNSPLESGRLTVFYPWGDWISDIGLLVGAGVDVEGYGFRARPYLYRHRVRFEYAPGLGLHKGARVTYDGDFRRSASETHFRLRARVSDIEELHFFGFGNETPSLAAKTFYTVDQTQYILAPTLVIPRGPVQFSVGLLAKHSSSSLAADRFIASVRPYGSQPFGQIGTQLGVELDTRQPRAAARTGVLLRVAGTAYPAVWSVANTFGEAHGEAAGHLALPGPFDPSLSLRVGGQRVWGPYPFHEAAFLGGFASLRGLHRGRYAGDAALFGNAELRLRLGRIKAVLPADVGVFGSYDRGRVFFSSETSNLWHHGLGGGLWLAFRDNTNVISLSAARSEGHTSVYLKGGLLF
jgi:hypothetical protein